MEHPKIRPFASCDQVFRSAGRGTVHRHGSFGRIHPAHLKRLAEARRLGNLEEDARAVGERDSVDRDVIVKNAQYLSKARPTLAGSGASGPAWEPGVC